MTAAVDLVWSLSGVAALLLVPGPTNTLLAAAGALAPTRPPLRLAAVELAGYLVSVGGLAFVGEGVAAALPAALPVVRLGLALWLLWLARGLWRAPLAEVPAAAVAGHRVFVATLLNPKGAIFAFGFVPVGADAATLATWFAGFAALVIGAGVTWIVAGGATARLWGAAASRLLPRLAATVLAGFAVALALRTIAATT